MDQDEIKVKSLKKALDVLNCFLVKSTWGVTEISDRLGLYKSNGRNFFHYQDSNAIYAGACQFYK